MKKLLLIIFLINSLLLPQTKNKYLVFFKDKGIQESNRLSKSSEEYQLALTDLSPRSIERREKHLGENIIDFRDIQVKENYVKNIEEIGAEIIWELKWFNAVSCSLNSDQINDIKKLSFVEKVEKVKSIKVDRSKITNSSLSKSSNELDSSSKLDYGSSFTQNNLSDIPIIHDLGYSGQDIIVGLLDGGFAWKNHPSLSSADVLFERDFVYGDNDTDDGLASHGTAVFSIIGGYDEGWLIGPAYNAKYVLAKTEDVQSESRIEEDNYAAALEWMESLGVDITSSSLGYSEFDNPDESYTYKDMDGKTTIVTQASEIAFLKGMITISSAGNEGNKTWKYITAPSDGFNTICVGAVDAANQIASFSSIGPSYDNRIKPEIVAQGVSCYHAVAYTEGYNYGGGTSFAAPIASGIAAQLMSAYPHLKNTQVRRIIIESGDHPEKPDITNYERGYGLLSAKRALEYPNLNESNGFYTLNKMFIDSLITDDDSVYVAIYRVGDDYIPVAAMEKQDGYYTFEIPTYSVGTELEIQFSVVDSEGNGKSIENPLYTYIYGSLDIVRYTGTILPQEFALSQNYPNPFNGSTTINIDIPSPTSIDLTVYNILGQKIKTIFSGEKLQGSYKFFWNGSDDFNRRVASGVYFYRVKTQSTNSINKMILLN